MKSSKKLYEKYRPKSFKKVAGQDKAIKIIKHNLSRGWGGKAWWISGVSGVGKTTLARIIASKSSSKPIVCEYNSANEVTANLTNDFQRNRNRASFFPVAYIINEAHALRKPIIQSLLGILEHLNDKQVFIFTTTKTGQEDLLENKMDAGPLLSRCIRIELTNQGLAEPFARRCLKIAKKEGLDGGKSVDDFIKLAKKCRNNFRSMLVEIESGCMLD